MKRLLGIGVVWFGCGLAWVVLGSTLLVRSGESSESLSSEVQQLWGPELAQMQPHAAFSDVRVVRDTRTVTDDEGNTSQETREEQQTVWIPVALVASDLRVGLELEHRRRGLVWFPTYGVDFRGRYTFRNTDAEAREIVVTFPLEAENAVYDGFRVVDGSGAEVASTIGALPAPSASSDAGYGRSDAGYETSYGGNATWRARLAPGERATFEVAYRARGTGTWRYRMANGTTRVDDFRLAVTTNFSDVDFPAGTLSPTEHGARGSGWRGVWAFDSLIANRPIGIEPPARINPGPLAARITFFAPVGLLFFFFVVAILASAQRRDLHPMHFFFVGCAFFAFHLLFGYLVDHLSIPLSFGLSAGVSILLVVSYARLFVGWRFALLEMGASQLIYLVLFSGTFMWEGFTGLTITVGAVLTLFVMMQITGRTAWGKAKPPAHGEPQRAAPPSSTPTTF